MLRVCSFLAAFCAAAPAALFAQDLPAPSQQAPTVRDLRISGTKELSTIQVVAALPVHVGESLTEPTERIAEQVERRYRDEGYTFARAKADFDAASGALTISIDEGVIDGVEFEGVDGKLARTFVEEFALHSGDVFNSRRARHALNALLRPTRGAVTPDRVAFAATPRVFNDTRELRREEPRRTFDLVDRDGRRILRVGLRERAGRFKLSPNLGNREDWFTPVDGFVPALDFGAAVFDRERFNHTFLAGHVSIKTASGNVGYALGVERPLFGARKLFLGAELHDLTATDDMWQLSSTEASLAAFGPRRSYRDYYRRRGVQFSGAFRAEPHTELFVAWRGERHAPLETTTDFSLWNDEEPFRPNLAARDGRLSAVVVGASIDSRGFDRESLDTTYRRHQFESLFGDRLSDSPDSQHAFAVWRVDWTSEISAPEALNSDFDFRRHIVSGRGRVFASRHQEVGARVLGGWSGGVLPPQRQFALGGIGSVHGYPFKASTGDTLRLMNVEYAVGWHNGPQFLAFLDAGKTTLRPTNDLRLLVEPSWMKGAGWGVGLGGFRVEFGYPLRAGPRPVQVLLRFARTF